MTLAQLKYNPGLRGDDELIRSFVVRKSLFELVLETLRENTGPANQHILIVGPRGSGKTTLVRRVAAEVRIDSELSAAWYPLVFAEESYLVSTSGEFWLEALFHLADQTQDKRWERAYRELQGERDEARLRDRALAQLMDFADENGARLLLIVENLNMLLGEQMSNGADWELRHTLLNEPRVMLIGTATNRFNEIENIDRAWFELFAIHDLRPLPQDECLALWESVASSDLPAQKIRPIQILTGGNPRLLKILAEFAVRRSLRELMDHLVHLIDEHTEYFKSHLDGLAPMERKVFVALLDLWDPASAREVGQVARMDTSRVSVHLNRLGQRGAVDVLENDGRHKIYQVAERLYNIYFLMRRRGHPASRVRAAVAFMLHFYDESDLISVTAHIAEEACQLPPEQRQDHYRAYQEIISRAREQNLQMKIIRSTTATFFDAPDLPAELRQVQWRRLVDDLMNDSNDLDDTIEARIMELIECEPENEVGWILLGLLFSRTGRYCEAEDAYRTALEICKDLAAVWILLGSLLQEKMSRFDEAEKAYRRAVEVQPENIFAWTLLAELLHEHLLRYHEAQEAYRNAIKIQPTNPWIWTRLGKVLYDQASRLEKVSRHKSIESTSETTDIQSDEAESWKLRGKLQKIGKMNQVLTDARDAFTRAIYLFARDNWVFFRENVMSIADAAATDSHDAAAATEMLMTAAAAGYAEETLQILSASKGAAALEPLLVGLQIYLGVSPRKAQEIMEVGGDVAQRIRDRRKELSQHDGMPSHAALRAKMPTLSSSTDLIREDRSHR